MHELYLCPGDLDKPDTLGTISVAETILGNRAGHAVYLLCAGHSQKTDNPPKSRKKPAHKATSAVNPSNRRSVFSAAAAKGRGAFIRIDVDSIETVLKNSQESHASRNSTSKKRCTKQGKRQTSRKPV